jgi:hypothetical protein
MPMKSLKLEKENSRMEENVSQAAKNLRNEKDILAQELINLNREITRLKVDSMTWGLIMTRLRIESQVRTSRELTRREWNSRRL